MVNRYCPAKELNETAKHIHQWIKLNLKAEDASDSSLPKIEFYDAIYDAQLFLNGNSRILQ